jgi:hypothetical protein
VISRASKDLDRRIHRRKMHDTTTSSKQETAMPVFMVERSLKGIPMNDLAKAQQAAIATSRDFTADGMAVRYIRSTFVPSTGACMCLFEANEATHVKQVNERAGIPFDRITEALDLTP